MNRLVLALLLVLSACNGPAPVPTQPTAAPFTLPSALAGDWIGTDGVGHPATLHGDGVTLSGTVDGWALVLRDDHALTVASCQIAWDQLWTIDPRTFAFTSHACFGNGRWTFTRTP